MNEFALIRRYFEALTPAAPDVVLGIGDDCALLRPEPGQTLAVTTDTLISGRHFPADTAAADIGWKALAVSLSDLAAMAAAPRWFTLALSLPEADDDWLAGFCEGLREMALQGGIALVGGDTTRGALSITITAFGSVPAGMALRRSGARPGDCICVTGTLGDAALGLARGAFASLRAADERSACAQTMHDDRWLRGRLDRPMPRIKAGLALRTLATAAIDLSDGLAGDLRHLLEASGVGADIDCDRLPMSDAFARQHEDRRRLALQAAGGDDYELCVCIPPSQIDVARAAIDTPLTVIGRITAEPGLRWRDAQAAIVAPDLQGHRHFDD
ncbi:MAG: thiamine-phosphate kinase [Nevskia sp.]